MLRQKIWLILTIPLVIGVAGSICGFTTTFEAQKKGHEVLKNVRNCGNGVYYFNYKESDHGFTTALSKFIKEYPELELVALAPDDTDFYGSTGGYIAVFRKKND